MGKIFIGANNYPQIPPTSLFYEFIRLVQEVVLEPLAVQVASKCVDLSLQFLALIWLRRCGLACHGCGCLGAE